MAEIFAETSPEIDRFVDMYEGADRTPAVVGQDDLMVAGIVSTRETQPELAARVYLSDDQTFRIETPTDVEVNIYNYLGQRVQQTYLLAGEHNIPTSLRRQLTVVHLYSPEGQFTRTIWVP